MPCNFCGDDAVGVSAGAHADIYCERCGTLMPADESAELFLDKLRLLGRFGLATHTRLLLGTARGEG
jgi:hypothetical protein